MSKNKHYLTTSQETCDPIKVPGSPLIPYSEPIIELPSYLLSVIKAKNSQNSFSDAENDNQNPFQSHRGAGPKALGEKAKVTKKRKFLDFKRSCCEEDDLAYSGLDSEMIQQNRRVLKIDKMSTFSSRRKLVSKYVNMSTLWQDH